MPDEGAVRRIGESFAQKAEENLQLRAKYVKGVDTPLMPNRNTSGKAIKMQVLQVLTSLKM